MDSQPLEQVVTADEQNPSGKAPSDAPASEAQQAAAEAAASTPAPAADEPSELERVIAERDKQREQLLRTAADFDNYRKRTRREIDDAHKRGQQEIVRDLLPVFDNLERAVAASSGATDLVSVLEGVRMVLKLFEDTSERLGLHRIKTVGERFDPAVHEAIQQKESHEHAPGTIIAEVVPGYRFGEKLVRAAMVVVARKPSEPKPEPTPAEAAPAATEAGEAKTEAESGKAASVAPAAADAASERAASQRPPSQEAASQRPPAGTAGGESGGGSEGQGA